MSNTLPSSSSTEQTPDMVLAPPEIPSPEGPSEAVADEGVRGDMGLAIQPPDCTITYNANFEAEVLRLTNAERVKAGVRPLKLNDALTRAARSHAMDLACHNIGGHIGSNGSTPQQRALAVGYPGAQPPDDPYPYVRENAASGQDNPQGVVNDWMGSEGHRGWILNPKCTETGIGYVKRDGSTYTHYWVQVFGNPDGS